MDIKIRKKTLISCLIYIFLSISYYFIFVEPDSYKQVGDKYFSYAYTGDYLAYSHIFDSIREGSWKYVLDQNFWITYFYVHLGELVNVDENILSLIINIILFILSYYFIVKICVRADLSTKYLYLFFLNPQLIYYSQTINKEPPTLFFVVVLAFFLISNKRYMFFVAMFMAAMLRHQLVIYAFFLYFLFGSKKYKLRVFYAYIISALGAAIYSTMYDAGAIENSRFVMFVYELNTNYYIGNLIFAPVKLVQWVYDQLFSIIFIDVGGEINLYYLRDVVAIAFIAIFFSKLLRLFLNIEKYSKYGERVFLSMVISYVFMLLINPMIHQRYLFPIEVLLVVLAVSASHFYTGKMQCSNSKILA